MSDKREVLQTYLAGHNIPKEISEKISYTSISTPNFSYYAFRVGNSIGDVLELAMDFILAKKNKKGRNYCILRISFVTPFILIYSYWANLNCIANKNRLINM